jgi:hypothetical protein
MKPPMQPLVIDPLGVVRFQENRIVWTLLEYCRDRGLGLNELAMLEFSQADRTQFAQLIGYSLSGFHELSYVSDADALAASEAARQIHPEAGGCRDSGCETHSGVAAEDD